MSPFWPGSESRSVKNSVVDPEPDPKLFAGPGFGAVIINFGSGSDKHQSTSFLEVGNFFNFLSRKFYFSPHRMSKNV